MAVHPSSTLLLLSSARNHTAFNTTTVSICTGSSIYLIFAESWKLGRMESRQALWHNRRVQRSGLFAFFVLTFIVIALYTRRDWPEVVTEIQHGGATEGSHFTPQDQDQDEPLHDPKIPQFDPDNMPKIPAVHTSVAQPAKSTEGAQTKDYAENPTKEPIKGTSKESSEISKEDKDSPLPEGTIVLSKHAHASVASKLDQTRVAMIIETRKMSHMPSLLATYINILPPAWVLRMIGTPDAFENVQQSAALARFIDSGKLVLTPLPDAYPVAGQEELSATLTNLTFYRDFLAPAEWLLVFQADSIICAASEQSLDDWVDRGYDWIGAPWNPDVTGGNGGLSLRNVPAIVNVLEKESRKPNDPMWEDRWLCDRLKKHAPPMLMATFSVESVWYERPLGYHLRGSGRLLDGEIWINATRRRHIFRYCPETKLILGNMKLQDADDEKQEQDEKDAIAKTLGIFVEKTAEDISSVSKSESVDRHSSSVTEGSSTTTSEQVMKTAAADKLAKKPKGDKPTTEKAGDKADHYSSGAPKDGTEKVEKIEPVKTEPKAV